MKSDFLSQKYPYILCNLKIFIFFLIFTQYLEATNLNYLSPTINFSSLIRSTLKSPP